MEPHGKMLTISDAVAEILAEADAEIAGLKPVCRASGRCCKFEVYGHRLYVTAAEMVHFDHVCVKSSPPGQIENQKSKITNPPAAGVSLQQFFADAQPQGCPYQVGGLCTARDARPLGCRIYFCDENAQSWQNAIYEKYHARLRALHEQFGLPYRYLEWRQALRELADQVEPAAGA